MAKPKEPIDILGLDPEETGAQGWGAEFSDPPIVPTGPPVRKIPMREFSPEELRQQYKRFREEEEILQRRSTTGSKSFSKAEIARGYRKL